MIQTTDFTDIDGREDTTQTTALGTTQPSAMDMAPGELVGDFAVEDIKFPRLNFVQKSGNLSNDFDFGDIVLSKEHRLAGFANKGDEVSSPVELIIVSLRKFYQERTEYNSGIIPASFNSLAEVQGAGLTTRWGANGEKPTAEAVIDTRVLVKKPDDLISDAFPYDIDGMLWSPAGWFLARTAYKAAFTNVIGPKLAIELRVPGLLAGRWELRSQKVTKGDNTYVIPKLHLLPERNNKQFQDTIRELTAL